MDCDFGGPEESAAFGADLHAVYVDYFSVCVLKAHQIYLKLAVRHCLSTMRMSLRVVVVGVGLHLLYLVEKRMN